MKLHAAAGMAEKEELRWKAAAGALHRQQEVYLRLLERTVGLEPSRDAISADGVCSDHIIALEAAVMESREAHASTLREAREREISLEAHVSEQAAALRGQAVQLDAILRRSRHELEQAERRAEAERRTLALEMRSVENESIAEPDRLARLRAALERRLLARELRGVELRAPPVAEEEVDFEAASAHAVRCLEAAFASLRRKAEAAEADQRGQAELEWQRSRTAELASALFHMAARGGGRNGGGRAAASSVIARELAAADADADADVDDPRFAAVVRVLTRLAATAASPPRVSHLRSENANGRSGVSREAGARASRPELQFTD
jgi:protein-tyrosine-phosphatase